MKEIYRFTADTIECFTEDEVQTIALADDPVEPDNFIIITRLDDKVNASVDDGIGFLTPHSDYEMIGAIIEIALTENDLQLQIKPEFIEHYGSEFFQVNFDRSMRAGNKLKILEDSLVSLCDGSQVVLHLFEYD
ncbi:hypothetical protein [Providencia burhodogranariea]|uniref:Uncharacterized protein n=1 Tax=Providencia burhodogranariea DSM 19968 TaxID=1141662 RepID=K8W9Z3_9GAMM|nr:hypothetical protein [Providencia burhodogranariea]EKT53035.1 hypothetical protein OOA_19219 [Providencia burhodogranariea DSM 19968]